MERIELTNGGVALVDDDDADVVRQRKWTRASGGKDKNYAITTINGRTARLHRLLMQPGRGFVVDHINGDGLDNRHVAAVLRFGEFACLNFPHVFPEVPSRRKA